MAEELHEPGTVVGPYEEARERALVFGILLQVSLCEFLLYLLLVGGVDDGDARTLEARSREASAPDTGQRAHDLVDGDELRAATLVVVDARLAAVEAEFSEEFQVARLPCRDALPHTPVFAVVMLGPPCEPCRHGYLCLLERGLRDVAKECLVERLSGWSI